MKCFFKIFLMANCFWTDLENSSFKMPSAAVNNQQFFICVDAAIQCMYNCHKEVT